MKKIFIYLFGLLIAFASCAKIEEMSFEDLRNNAPQEVVFNLNTVKVTRAMVNTIDDFTEDFGVYGYIKHAEYIQPTDSIFMRNARYYGNADPTKLGTSYTKYYWPKSDIEDIKANFVAYYPYDANADTIQFDNVNNKVIYRISQTTVKDTVGDITDVMFAFAKEVSPKNNNVNPGTDTISPGRIPLNFQHALSLIQFQGRRDSVIDSVGIKEIYFSKNVNGDTVRLFRSGNLSIDILDPKLPATITGNNIDKDSINFVHTSVLDTCYKAISTTVIIPQIAPDYVTMKYDIKLKYDSSTVEYQQRVVTRKIQPGTPDDNNKNYPAAGSDSAQWTGGYRYIYRYFISVEEIKFDVKVDPWKESWNQVWDTDNGTYEVF